MAKGTSTDDTYDAIVIGTGQAGKPLARTLAAAGWKTAVIEREHVGGTCINVGCTPTKTMVASARVAYLARRSADYGVHDGSIRVDLGEVRRRKQAVVESFRGGSQRRLERTPNLELIFGEASFTGPRALEVKLLAAGSRSLAAERVFINVGCRPVAPALKGIDHVPFLDSSSIMELDAYPEHLMVLGGGYIGLEFGQMFRRFGSRVTIVQRSRQLLSREDEDVAGAVAQLLREDGIEVLLETKALEVSRPTDGTIRFKIQTPDGERVHVMEVAE